MIEPGQQFVCYIKHHAEIIDGEAVNGHRNFLGEDCAGQIAFNGDVFTCESVELHPIKGVVVRAGDFELRQDHFIFEACND